MMNRLISRCLLLFYMFIIGCASVPKEVVELSYLVGEDLHQLHISHRELAMTHFDGLRAQAISFLDTKWKPIYLAEFINEGGLVEKARGGNPNEVLEDVQLWAEVALEEIEKKRNELVDPIDEDERTLLAYIDESFMRVIRANAVVTAHLNSLREVEEVQNQLLESLKLGDMRAKINKGLIEASNKSQNAIQELEKILEKAKKEER